MIEIGGSVESRFGSVESRLEAWNHVLKVNITLPAELQPLQYRLLVVEALNTIRSECVSRLQNNLG